MEQKKEFKVGDKVYDYLLDRWGQVTRVNDDFSGTCPVKVKFEITEQGLVDCRTYTIDGRCNSDEVIQVLFHEKPTLSTERVVLVSQNGVDWHERVFIKKIDGTSSQPFVTWANATCLESAKTTFGTTSWRYMKEINEVTELTMQEIADKFGIPVSKLKIKK